MSLPITNWYIGEEVVLLKGETSTKVLYLTGAADVKVVK
jgi:hypothetical protein